MVTHPAPDFNKNQNPKLSPVMLETPFNISSTSSPASLPGTSQITFRLHRFCPLTALQSMFPGSWPNQYAGFVSLPSKAVLSFLLSGTRLPVRAVKLPLITKIYLACCSFDQSFFISAHFHFFFIFIFHFHLPSHASPPAPSLTHSARY